VAYAVIVQNQVNRAVHRVSVTLDSQQNVNGDGEYGMATRSLNIAVLDLETDPFAHGEMVQPFLSGFYDGTRLVSYWSDDCIKKMVDFLEKEKTKWVIYAHNGGRFDFFYFLHYLAGRGGPGNGMRIINNRIVTARLGIHELRDSYAIMPFPLSDYSKDVIDYKLFERGRRESHREEIQKYFRKDLTSLHELVIGFHAEFGDNLTIGSTAIRELKKFSTWDNGNGEYDKKFRKDFYFGGRNQVFRGGIINGDIHVYDVNSMYPSVMRACLHPIGTTFDVARKVQADTVFVVAEGRNFGAFPMRQPNNSLDFTTPSGIFCTTIHEWNAALDTGTFKPDRIIKTYSWKKQASFEQFVDHFYSVRMKAKASGNKILEIFYKYILNSAYGKFAQNPENYSDWFITAYDELPPDDPDSWTPAYIFQNSYIIWKRPLKSLVWYNVATGASITGAARAALLRGICATKDPLYCDTDSIICRGASRVPVHATGLGLWDLEARGSVVAIAGKKMYAVFDSNVERVKAARAEKKKAPPEILNLAYGSFALVKKAHKGAILSGAEILRIAKGETIQTQNPVPAFHWDGTVTFTERKIRRTAK
jgi:DNA polymerase type B, organellar and viral